MLGGVLAEQVTHFEEGAGVALEPVGAGVSVDQLRKIPQVIAVVSGGDRSAALLAAIRGRLVKSLVIDEVGAAALLAQPAPARSAPARKKAKK